MNTSLKEMQEKAKDNPQAKEIYKAFEEKEMSVMDKLKAVRLAAKLTKKIMNEHILCGKCHQEYFNKIRKHEYNNLYDFCPSCTAKIEKVAKGG